MNRKIVSEILAGQWFIQRQWAEAHLPLVIALLQGSNAISFVERTGNEGVEQPFVVDPLTMQRYQPYAFVSGSGYVPNPNIPPNSVGIIPISGPITYYNGDCGEPGMMQRTNWLMDFMRRDNIGSIVQVIDTPGGVNTAAPAYVAEMKKRSKPILSLVDNFCASLGIRFSAESDETYLSHDMSKMGSVGSYTMFLDYRGMLEKEGIKLHEIYAPQSIDKNKDYRDALDGDYSLMKADLKKAVDHFINHVKASRGSIAAANEKEWNSGKMFYPDEAVKFGLADGIRPFSQVVGKAAWLGKRFKK